MPRGAGQSLPCEWTFPVSIRQEEEDAGTGSTLEGSAQTCVDLPPSPLWALCGDLDPGVRKRGARCLGQWPLCRRKLSQVQGGLAQPRRWQLSVIYVPLVLPRPPVTSC